MNTLSKKLRDLENNVLELPEVDDILLHIGDGDEQQLHEHARRIRDSLRVQAEEIINDSSLARARISTSGNKKQTRTIRLVDEKTRIQRKHNNKKS